MAYVVTEACVGRKLLTCVGVCPVDAFHETPDRLYINPDTCIDCNACVDECPVEAIYPDTDLPEEMEVDFDLNATSQKSSSKSLALPIPIYPSSANPDADQ